MRPGSPSTQRTGVGPNGSGWEPQVSEGSSQVDPAPRASSVQVPLVVLEVHEHPKMAEPDAVNVTESLTVESFSVASETQPCLALRQAAGVGSISLCLGHIPDVDADSPRPAPGPPRRARHHQTASDIRLVQPTMTSSVPSSTPKLAGADAQQHVPSPRRARPQPQPRPDAGERRRTPTASARPTMPPQ